MRFYKKITLVVICCASSIVLNANSLDDVTYSSRNLEEHLNSTNKENFFYNKGFKDGFEDGKRKGYAQAIREAKRAIDMYKKRIEAYEVSKYLSRKGKITPPRLYQKRDENGKVEIVVKGCEVRGKLTTQDILLLPNLSKDEYSTTSGGGFDYHTTDSHSTPSDSVFLAGVDRGVDIAKPTHSLVRKTTLVFRDTNFFRKLLRASGVIYTIEANGGGLRAIFASKREAENFIKNNNFLYGKDYK